MAVQQGQLSPTDTTKNMENFYDDAVVSEVSDVDRVIHNGTQFVRLVLQRPQPISASVFTTSGSLTIDASELIDSSFVNFPTTGVNQVTISFDALVSTSSIVVYSTSAIDTNTVNWTVQSSLNNDESEFSNSAFNANVTNVTSEIINQTELIGATSNKIKYTISVDTQHIDTTNDGLT